MLLSIIDSMRRVDTVTEDNKSESWKLFDSIHRKYDLLNRILSFGLDSGWRKKIVKKTSERNKIRLADFASGTGDVLISFLKYSGKVEYAVGSDLSEMMLGLGFEKIKKFSSNKKAAMVRADAANTPFKDGNFNVATIAFGIRNMADPVKVLSEMARVLEENGDVFILEFSLPKNRVTRRLHLFYLRRFIPLTGKLIAGNYEAYRYLDKTIESFPYGENFMALMNKVGFSNCSAETLAFGAVTLYRGIK